MRRLKVIFSRISKLGEQNIPYRTSPHYLNLSPSLLYLTNYLSIFWRGNICQSLTIYFSFSTLFDVANNGFLRYYFLCPLSQK